MYDFKEIEIYKPQSKIVSTWEINEKCSDLTKKKLSYFLEKCEKLEMIFADVGCDLVDFYWYTSDNDDIYLNLEFNRENHEKFKSIIKDLKVFFIDDLVCRHENTDFLNSDINGGTRKECYVSSYESKVTIQVSLDRQHWNSYIPTPDYFYASMW